MNFKFQKWDIVWSAFRLAVMVFSATNMLFLLDAVLHDEEIFCFNTMVLATCFMWSLKTMAFFGIDEYHEQILKLKEVKKNGLNKYDCSSS